MINYTWEILSNYTVPLEGGLPNVIKKVNWRFQASEGPYSADIYEVTELDLPDPSDYTVYDNLTDEQVISWVKSKIDYDNLVERVNIRLEDQKFPKLVEKSPPWIQPFPYTGDEQYLMVFNNDIADVDGPFTWNANYINSVLKSKSIVFELDIDRMLYNKRLVPVSQPLHINDQVSIYRISDIFQLEIADRVYKIEGPTTWSIQNGTVVGHRSVHDKTLEQIKEELTAKYTFQVDTIYDEMTNSLNIELLMFCISAKDTDSFIFKEHNQIQSLTKLEIADIIRNKINALNLQRQTLIDKINAIAQCSSVEEIIELGE
jgi:hypothetical protein